MLGTSAPGSEASSRHLASCTHSNPTIAQGQPALLYLVPCTLGVSLALAHARGDLRAMWAGSASDPKAADPVGPAEGPAAAERGTLLAPSSEA